MKFFNKNLDAHKLLLSLITLIFYLYFYLYSLCINFTNLITYTPHYLYIFISIILATVSVYDIYTKFILKFIIEAGIISLFAYLYTSNYPEHRDILSTHLIASISIYVLFYLTSFVANNLTKKTLLGFGDARVAALGGALLGPKDLFAAISIAFITSGLFGILGTSLKFLKPWQQFPFSPFICISIGIVWNFGKDFWLVRLFVI